uniref:Nitroreductase family protein n=1 Tax=Stygiella incarcerata TaxID=1712417 RepID=A0A192ZJH7_9EUKA|nr:nitroreductase family protein [Stygiella incarcerata]
MSVSDIIHSRRSNRAFDSSRAVPKEALEKIVNAALLAPSAMNQQPWRIYVSMNDEFLRKVGLLVEEVTAKSYPGILSRKEALGVKEAIFYDAPAVLFITKRKDLPAPVCADIDIGLCLENAILAVYELGLTCVPVALPAMFGKDIINDHLKIDTDKEEFMITLPIGYARPDYEGPTQKALQEGTVVWLDE